MKKGEFNIPIAGLKDKVYHFEYELNELFFEAVTETLITDPDIQLDLTLDKTHEPYVLDFSIAGSFVGECDRCGTPVSIPVEATYRLFAEFGQPAENEDDSEVIFISRDDDELRLFDHVYDFAMLSIPMVKRCSAPGDRKNCDKKVAAFLKDSPLEEGYGDPRWDALKKLKQ